MRSRILGLLLSTAIPAWARGAGLEGTFSIIARDPATGVLGMAVHSKTLAVGSRTITIKGRRGRDCERKLTGDFYHGQPILFRQTIPTSVRRRWELPRFSSAQTVGDALISPQDRSPAGSSYISSLDPGP